MVLTGGRSSRLGGVPKPDLRVGGSTMAARVLAAVRDADRSIVVGPAVRDMPVDLVTREEPPGGGPVAGLAAGLVGVRAPMVAVLAADLPFLDAATVRELRAALAARAEAVVALPVDARGATSCCARCGGPRPCGRRWRRSAGRPGCRCGRCWPPRPGRRCG